MILMNKPAVVPLLLITGTVGAGKSAVAAEISEILSDQKVSHAFVDLDALSYCWPPRGRFNRETALENLASLWTNFQAAGIQRLVVAAVVETPADWQQVVAAVPGAAVVICRLVAPQAIRESRLRGRETGRGLAWHLARTVALEEILEQANLEDFRVENGARALGVVALEVLQRAGWLAGDVA
jgi:hypothetical protein